MDEIPQGKDVNEEDNKGTPILFENWASQISVSPQNLVHSRKTQSKLCTEGMNDLYMQAYAKRVLASQSAVFW